MALWSANAAPRPSWMRSMLLQRIKKRSFVRLNLVALAFTLGTIFALMLALGAVVVARIVLFSSD